MYNIRGMIRLELSDEDRAAIAEECENGERAADVGLQKTRRERAESTDGALAVNGGW